MLIKMAWKGGVQELELVDDHFSEPGKPVICDQGVRMDEGYLFQTEHYPIGRYPDEEAELIARWIMSQTSEEYMSFLTEKCLDQGGIGNAT